MVTAAHITIAYHSNQEADQESLMMDDAVKILTVTFDKKLFTQIDDEKLKLSYNS